MSGESETPEASGKPLWAGRFGEGLRRAVYNFMHGVGLESDVRTWFDFPMPRPSREALRAGRQPRRSR